MTHSYPLAQELIIDPQGQIQKVVLKLQDYQKIIEAFEDEALLSAILTVKDETPLTMEQALGELDEK